MTGLYVLVMIAVALVAGVLIPYAMGRAREQEGTAPAPDGSRMVAPASDARLRAWEQMGNDFDRI